MLRRFRQSLRRYARTTYYAGSPLTAWRLCIARAGVAEVRLPNYPGTFRVRCGTTDAEFVRALATCDFPPEYTLPDDLAPRVIFDIGANIGCVAAAMLQRWPTARLYAFEPLPENAALVEHNLRAYPNATVLNYGLGDRTARLTYERSDDQRNFGGGGFYGRQGDQSRCVPDVPVVAVAEALEQLQVDEIDVIKVDTEGAEHAILTSFPVAVLRRTRVIVGELHGKPRDAELLDYLGQWFELQVQMCHRTHRPRYFRAVTRGSTAPREQHRAEPAALCG